MPPSFTVNVKVPAGRFENFDSLNANSLGFPAVTLILVTFAAPARAEAVAERVVAGDALANPASRSVTMKAKHAAPLTAIKRERRIS
jgi:hypothetical protein